MNKVIVGSIIFTVLALGGIVALVRSNGVGLTTPTAMPSNVTVVDGKQVIQIAAKGGYLPRVTVAKANMPTVLNVATNGTYDCSSALVIAAVGFRKSLPATGVTPIEIPPQKPGTSLKGLCAMGMYNFTVSFQ